MLLSTNFSYLLQLHIAVVENNLNPYQSLQFHAVVPKESQIYSISVKPEQI